MGGQEGDWQVGRKEPECISLSPHFGSLGAAVCLLCALHPTDRIHHSLFGSCRQLQALDSGDRLLPLLLQP